MEAVPGDDARLKLALKAGGLGIWEWRIDGDELYWSPETYAIVGVSDEEFHPTPRTFRQLVHPDDAERVCATVDECVANRTDYRVECRIVRPDGSTRWVASRGVVVVDAIGRATGMIGTLQDISDRVSMLDALTESRERLQAALDAAQTGTWRWDLRTNTLDWDENLHRLFGLPPGRTVRTLDDFIALVDPEDRPAVAGACQESIDVGTASRLEYRVVWPDGTVHWIDDRGRTVADDKGRPAYMTGACVDVTARKQVERMLRENELRKDDFLAMLAHELRNPLAPIRNSVEILRQLTPPDSVSAEASAIIERQTRHLVRLVDDLLDVSRIARGKIELRRERCSLADIVRHTVDDYRQVFRDRGIVVTVSTPPDDLLVEGDPTRLSQIVSNILHNSSKFTPKGGAVTIALTRDDSRQITVTVADTGCGIESELLDRLFLPFAQGRRDDPAQGGLGLGLAVVRGLVELHGGSVEASSDGPGRGATVTVRLPPYKGDTAAPKPPFAPSASSALRVLVLDDNVDAADSLCTILGLLGHATDAVYLGQDAIGRAERTSPDVLLCDIGLPGGMDGYEVARQFRARPALRHVHLIALTGWGQVDDRQKALAAGFDLHLTKPVDLDHLQSVLADIGRRLPRR